MIKLEALRVFVTVADAGNIRDAAARLSRTPSAVSMSLKALEEDVGGPLFERGRKNALTALGAFTRDLADRQLSSFDGCVGAIRAFARHEIGRLSVACVPSIAQSLMPEIVGRFVAGWPRVELELRDADSLTVESLVDRDAVDLGIAGPAQRAGSVHFELLFRDRFQVFAGTASALCSLRRPLRWTDLDASVLIRNGSSELIEAPQYRALAASSSLMVRNVTSLIALVRNGTGVTLLPELLAPSAGPGVATLELDDATVFRKVGLLTRADRSVSPTAAAFARLLRHELSAGPGPGDPG